jgi:hypothetical protein
VASGAQREVKEMRGQQGQADLNMSGAGKEGRKHRPDPISQVLSPVVGRATRRMPKHLFQRNLRETKPRNQRFSCFLSYQQQQQQQQQQYGLKKVEHNTKGHETINTLKRLSQKYLFNQVDLVNTSVVKNFHDINILVFVSISDFFSQVLMNPFIPYFCIYY